MSDFLETTSGRSKYFRGYYLTFFFHHQHFDVDVSRVFEPSGYDAVVRIEYN